MFYNQPKPCAGCGEPRRHLVGVQICPGVTREVCAHGSRSGDHEKESCVLKAAAAWHGCPGCGQQQDLGAWKARLLCWECRETLARGKSATPGKMVWGRIKQETVFGEYIPAGLAISEEDKALSEELPRLLAAALGPRVHSAAPAFSDVVALNDTLQVNGGGIYVELPEAQVPAVKALFEALKTAGQRLIEMGRERGHSVLMRLALGEITTADYERDRRQGR